VIKSNAARDSSRRNWRKFANAPDTVLPIQNLRLGIFSGQGMSDQLGVAFGDDILDVGAIFFFGGGALGF